MANLEQVERLLASAAENNGCQAWNTWRQELRVQRSRVATRNAITAGAVLSGGKPSEQYMDINQFNIDLSGANLSGTNLSNADLRRASVKDTVLINANLSGSNLNNANLSGTNLGRVLLSETTKLDKVILSPKTKCAGLRWMQSSIPDLTNVDWSKLPRFGDDPFLIWQQEYADETELYRTYQRLSIALRNQGNSDDADKYAYRSQVARRGYLVRNGHFPQYFLSHILNVLAGYGYRPFRTVIAYLLVIFGFAYLYTVYGIINTGIGAVQQFNWHEAIIFSITSFHGRGFFPGVASLDSPFVTLAAIEAVIGLVIEVSFIATFTQRFFAK